MRTFPKVSVNSHEAGGCPFGRLATKWAEARCKMKKLFPFCYNAVGQHFSTCTGTLKIAELLATLPSDELLREKPYRSSQGCLYAKL